MSLLTKNMFIHFSPKPIPLKNIKTFHVRLLKTLHVLLFY